MILIGNQIVYLWNKGIISLAFFFFFQILIISRAFKGSGNYKDLDKTQVKLFPNLTRHHLITHTNPLSISWDASWKALEMKPIGTQNYHVKTILMLLEQINVLQLVLQASIFVSVLIQSIKVVKTARFKLPQHNVSSFSAFCCWDDFRSSFIPYPKGMSIFKARLSQETFKTVRMAPRVKRTMSSLSFAFWFPFVKEPFTYYQQTQKQTSILLLKLFSLMFHFWS